ncbi:Gfo/Idh/MocA family protein [Streptomyces sp. NPDC047990]|uniref:Gfo/Idh/MocA family protein n=1 Tax=Streptomyces sp. NPDC047990 TaxID=3365496 RepID=UPI0037205DD8
MKNILVIGVGPHARRTHLPALAAAQSSGLVGAVCGVDVIGASDAMVAFEADDGPRTLPVTLIEQFDAAPVVLPGTVRSTLDALAHRQAIDAVVVATEPSYHLAYTRWALERGLSVLLDKPLSVRADCSTDPDRASAILDDTNEMLDCYRLARARHPQLLVAVQAQRRYHPAFWRIRELISDIADATSCPVTSIQSFHSDGQWRMPDEYVDLCYHGFERGYGKAAHSGYHFFDIVPWLLSAGERAGKELDTVDVHAFATRPADLLGQLGVGDHERLFPGFAARNPYPEADLRAITHRFGEVDAFLSMAYKSAGQTMTLGSINLVHNGFSQRGTLTAARSRLYKGNGRVRHENHIIEQGPFQAIHLNSLQALSDGTGADDSHVAGGDRHIELHVFRNNRYHQGWKKHTRYTFTDLTTATEAGPALPTQESSRRRAMQEFLDYLCGRRTRQEMTSELTSHRRGSVLMAGAYLSMAGQFNGTHPVATLDFRPSPHPAPVPEPCPAGTGAVR